MKMNEEISQYTVYATPEGFGAVVFEGGSQTGMKPLVRDGEVRVGLLQDESVPEIHQVGRFTWVPIDRLFPIGEIKPDNTVLFWSAFLTAEEGERVHSLERTHGLGHQHMGTGVSPKPLEDWALRRGDG
jgi:hypothetical protein